MYGFEPHYCAITSPPYRQQKNFQRQSVAESASIASSEARSGERKPKWSPETHGVVQVVTMVKHG